VATRTPSRPQGVQPAYGGVQVSHEQALGDLEHQALGGDAGFLEDGGHFGDELVVLELAVGHVDADPDASGPGPPRQHGELVAAESGHDVAGTRRGGDAAGHLGQQRVPDGVAPAVVHVLEVVDIEEAHGHGRGPARCGGP
jgi:hypothetical protein